MQDQERQRGDFLKIERRLSLSYGMLILLLLATIFLSTVAYFSHVIEYEQERLGSVIANSVGDSINKVSFSGKYQARLLIEELAKKNPNIDSIVIQEMDGKVIAHSRKEHNNAVMIDARFETAKGVIESGEHLVQRVSEVREGQTVDLIEIDMPFKRGYQEARVGVIRVMLTTDILGGFMRGGFVYFTLLIIFLTLFSIAVLKMLANRIGAPVRNMAFQLQGILTHAPLSIYISDRSGARLVASRRYADIAPYAEGEENQSIEQKVFQSGQVASYDSTLISGGEERHFHVTKYPISKDEKGAVAQVCTIALDITDRKNAQKELEEVNKTLEESVENEAKRRIEAEQMALQQSKMALMGEMIGAIAHQWRQPLNALGVTIQDIKDAYEYGELDETYISRTITVSMDKINFMSKTIDDFRNFFSPSKAKREFIIEEAVQGAIDIVSAQLKNHEIALMYQPAGQTPFFGYKSELQQVVLNILANAKDAIEAFHPADRKIVVSIEASNKAVSIAIEDTGGGIPPEIMGRIGEPYFTTKEQGKGTGVGLYMSRQIIERHMGGALLFENGERGARVVIRLPKNG